MKSWKKYIRLLSLFENECGREIDNKILLENVIFTAFHDCNGNFIHTQVQNLRASHFFFWNNCCKKISSSSLL